MRFDTGLGRLTFGSLTSLVKVCAIKHFHERNHHMARAPFHLEPLQVDITPRLQKQLSFGLGVGGNLGRVKLT